MQVSLWSAYRPLALAALVAAGVAGCQTASVTSGPTPAKCQLAFVAPAVIVADGGTAAISVTAPAECGWDVSTPTSWISEISPSSGQGNGTVGFRAAPNPTASPRQGEIVINQDRVAVSQEAVPCDFTITPAALTVTAAGGPGTVNVSTLTGCAWDAASDVPWITITTAPAGSGNGFIRISVASNVGTTSRTGTITIAGRSAVITQLAPQQTPSPGPAPAPGPAPPPPPPPCTYSITPDNYAVGADGGVGPTVSVAAGSTCNWSAVSNDSWITVTSGAIGTGNGSVDFTVAANPGSSRNGTLTIAGQTFLVLQGTNCTFSLNRLTVNNVPPTGATRSVIVTASAPLCSWTATTATPWITIVSGANTTGSGTVTFDVAANPGATRSGTLIVAGQVVTVTQ